MTLVLLSPCLISMPPCFPTLDPVPAPATPPDTPRRDQRWSTFLKNHAAAIIACDFCVAATTFRLLYVLVVMKHASRRIARLNITDPTRRGPSSNCVRAISSDHAYCFILHDRDAIFSSRFDASVAHLGLR